MGKREQPREVEPWRRIAFERGLADARQATRTTRVIRRQLRITDQGHELIEEAVVIEEQDNWR